MAIKPFNSVAGFSVGETPANIILANGDITTTNITTTGVSNLNSISNVKISGGTVGQVISTDGSGNLSFITIGTASLNNGSSNVSVLDSGNILFSIAGNANVVAFTGSGANIDGYANITGNANVGNIGTAQLLATANVTAPQLISNVSTGTAPLVVSSTTLVSNLNADLLDGYNSSVSTSANTVVVRDANGNVSANYFIGDGSQLTGIDTSKISNGNSNVSIPAANGNVNITADGNNVMVITGTGANIVGYANVSGNVTAGGIKTDNLYYANGSPWDLQEAAGSNTQIQYNDGLNNFGASANFTYDDATQLFTVTGSGAQVNVGANTYISNSQIWLGNTDWPNGAAYTQLTDTYISIQDGTGATSRYAGISIDNGLQYSNAAFNINIDETGIYQWDNDLSSQYNVYANAGVRALYGDGSSTTINGDEIDWTAADGNSFVANAAGAYHTQKFQAPQIVSNVATGTAPFVVTSTTQVANLNVANAGYATTAGTAGTVTTNAQPNITSVGTLSSLTVSGNISANNLSTTNKVVAGNGLQVTTGSLEILAGNLDVTGNINVTGNLNYSNVTDLVVGDPLIYIGANNSGDIYDLGIVASYNDGAYEHTGLARNAADDVWTFFDGVVAEPTTVIDWANASYPTVKMGNLITTANANIAGYANVVGNISVGNLDTAGTVAATGNVSGGNLTTGGVLSVTGNANVGNLGAAAGVFTANVTAGNIYANSGTIGANLLTGTLTTAAQPNITSVGTLTSLDVTGNVEAGNVLTDNLLYANGQPWDLQEAAGSNTQIQFNDGSNNFGASANLTFNNSTQVFTVNGDASVTGQVNIGNSSVNTGISWASVTTSAVTANQTIASFSVTGITGVEFLVKAIDSSGSKYSVATVQAVTDGSSVDYSTFGGVNLGGYTGSLAVNVVGGQLRLQVTPASSNSTVWTTQYRLI